MKIQASPVTPQTVQPIEPKQPTGVDTPSPPLEHTTQNTEAPLVKNDVTKIASATNFTPTRLLFSIPHTRSGTNLSSEQKAASKLIINAQFPLEFNGKWASQVTHRGLSAAEAQQALKHIEVGIKQSLHDTAHLPAKLAVYSVVQRASQTGMSGEQFSQLAATYQDKSFINEKGYLQDFISGQYQVKVGTPTEVGGTLKIDTPSGYLHVGDVYTQKEGNFISLDGQEIIEPPLGRGLPGENFLDGAGQSIAEGIESTAALLANPKAALSNLPALPAYVTEQIRQSPEYFSHLTQLPAAERNREIGKLLTDVGSTAASFSAINKMSRHLGQSLKNADVMLPQLALNPQGQLALHQLTVISGAQLQMGVEGLGKASGLMLMAGRPDIRPVPSTIKASSGVEVKILPEKIDHILKAHTAENFDPRVRLKEIANEDPPLPTDIMKPGTATNPRELYTLLRQVLQGKDGRQVTATGKSRVDRKLRNQTVRVHVAPESVKNGGGVKVLTLFTPESKVRLTKAQIQAYVDKMARNEMSLADVQAELIQQWKATP